MRFIPPATFNCRAHVSRRRGSILLEVVIALALFLGAVVVITGGFNSSLNSVERLRLNTHAANLAVSVMSELQMGTKSIALTEAQPFEAPFETWTWEAMVVPTDTGSADASPTKKIEVTVRHNDPEIVFHLTQVIRIPEPKNGAEADLFSLR